MIVTISLIELLLMIVQVIISYLTYKKYESTIAQ